MKKKIRIKKRVIKLFVIAIMITISFFLFYITYYIYSSSRKIEEYNRNINNYSYMIIKSMSEPFAEFESRKLHFVENNKNNIFIIAISEKDEKKYNKIIDYTYNRLNKAKEVKVYGLPIKANEEMKRVIVKNINKFLSYDKKNLITQENYYTYIPNTIFDTTIKEKYNFNYIVFILYLIFGIFFLILIKTIFMKKID